MPAVHLTDAFVKGARCRPGVALSEYRDTGLRGLELRVSDGGAKSWRLHYTRRSDGKRRAVALGTYPAIGLKEARRRAKLMQAEIEDGDKRADPAGKVKVRREAETFRELAESWIELHGQPNKSSRALQDDRSMLARHILPEIGDMKVREVTKRDIIRLLDRVAAKPDARQAGQAARRMTHRPNRVFELIRAILRWGVGRDMLQFDPSFGLSPPIKSEKPRERELSETEIKVLWDALGTAPVERRTTKGVARGQSVSRSGEIPMNKATALALKLALVTGQRIGEVTGIAMTELDLNDIAPIWIIPGARSKNRQPNRVPLSPLAVELIREVGEIARHSDWLFPSQNGEGPVDPHSPTKALERARPFIGLEDFRVHDLRRTAATRMAEMGISPHTISLVLNHISARRGTVTAKVYNQYSYDREKRAALEIWGERLSSIVSGVDGADRNGCKTSDDLRALMSPLT